MGNLFLLELGGQMLEPGRETPKIKQTRKHPPPPTSSSSGLRTIREGGPEAPRCKENVAPNRRPVGCAKPRLSLKQRGVVQPDKPPETSIVNLEAVEKPQGNKVRQHSVQCVWPPETSIVNLEAVEKPHGNKVRQHSKHGCGSTFILFADPDPVTFFNADPDPGL